MGTWGPGPFDNDDAADWLRDLEETEPSSRSAFIERTLSKLAEMQGYIQVDDGQAGIAAAAVVALQLPGATSMDLVSRPDSLEALNVDVDHGLREAALRALDRVEAGDSEVAGLWREGDPSDFMATLTQLRDVLSQQQP
jgi:hypothetical protein